MRISGTSRYLLAACVTRQAVTRPEDLYGLQELIVSLAAGLSTGHVDVLLEDCASAAGQCSGTYALAPRGPAGERVDRAVVRTRALEAPAPLRELTQRLLDLDVPVPENPIMRGDEHIVDWTPTDEELEAALVASTAYAIGRRSYIVGTVAQWLRDWSPQVGPQAARELVAMIDSAPSLGDRQDAEVWQQVRAQLLRGTSAVQEAAHT